MLKAYLSKSFSSSFITVFLPLFAIASLILLISTASLTSYIEVNLIQMGKIYLYSLPEILFYTMPLSFVIGLGVTLNRLSNDYELIILFASGANPFYIFRRFFLIAVMLSLFLLTLSIYIMPQAQQLFDAYKQDKSANAKLNIKPSELGQKFGNFFVYVADEDEKGLFKHVVVFQTDKDQDQLFISQKGDLQKQGIDTTFELIDGIGYTYDNNQINKINYKDLTLFQSSIVGRVNQESIYAYWQQIASDSDRREDLKMFILISLMPVVTFFAVAAFSVIHPRYQKNILFLSLSVIIVGYFILINFLSKYAEPGLIAGVCVLLSGLGYALFHQRVLRHY
ncbi:MAG: LptF/LptG family permease [Campylobacterota bacterium]